MDLEKVLMKVFNFEENQWTHLLTKENYGLETNLFLLSLHGNLFLYSHGMESYQFSATTSNYTMRQTDSWIDEKVLLKSVQLSFIDLQKVPKHLSTSKENV